jgi:ABC-2 type transport system ATP-binding protein
MTTSLAIEAEGLVKTFATSAPSTASTSRSARAVYGVLGPNGAGKTTTIRMLATLLKPDAGARRVLGPRRRARGRRVRERISLTGQLASVDEELTAREPRAARPAARLPPEGRRRPRGRAARRVRADRGRGAPGEELLGRHAAAPGHRREHRRHAGAHVPRRADHGPGPALAQPGLGHRRALVGQGTTVLLCTQYLDEADQLADRIAVIDHGPRHREGTPGQLKASVGPGRALVRLTDLAQRPGRPSGCSRAGLDATVTLDSTPPR